MARVINLTMPIYPDVPVGSAWAFDVPYQMEPIKTWEYNHAQMEYYEFGSLTGTHLLTAAFYDPAGITVGKLDLARLVDRPAVIVDIPKGAEELITGADIERAVAREADFAPGDALIIRTGWGDGERFRTLGEQFASQTPCFSTDGAQTLAAVMADKGSELLAIDIPYPGGRGQAHMQPEWTAIVPWQRPPWPAPQAKIYLKHYSAERFAADWGADKPLLERLVVVAGVCNAGAVKAKRVLLTVLPLFIEDAPASPATVVVKELA